MKLKGEDLKRKGGVKTDNGAAKASDGRQGEDRMEEQEEEEHPSVVESKTKKAEATVQVRRNNIRTFSVESERSFRRSRFQ